MLPTIAWRNVWRNPGRSLVVILAVALGIWALIFSMGFYNVIGISFVNNGIENQHGHIQIHHPEFKTDYDTKYQINDITQVLDQLSKQPNIQASTHRILCNGMLNTSRGSSGVQIIGIKPSTEAAISKLDTKIVEGAYLDEKARKSKPILISRLQAKKQKLKIRSKVILNFQSPSGEIIRESFKVVGLIDSKNSQLDESRVFVRDNDLKELLNMLGSSHETVSLLHQPQQLEQTAALIKAQHPELLVETWREASPELQLMESQIVQSMFIFIFIVMLALTFGIINTMLMAILERIKEIGMLMAVGMTKGRIFSMIVIETLLLSLVGVPLGILIGYVTLSYYNYYGLDLSNYGEGLSEFGMETIIYPELGFEYYLFIAASVAITAIIASMYPALKAIRLKPVEAIRSL